MAKQSENSKLQVVLFVEGDTNEVLFRALIDYYKGVSKTELNPCRICNLRGVTRYTSKLIAKLATVLLSASYSYHIRTIYLRLRSAYATPTLRYSYDSRTSEV